MRRTINIGDMEVAFEANAASFVYAQKIFKKDYINIVTRLSEEAPDFDGLTDLAFIFAKQAEMMDGKIGREAMVSLTEKDEIEWLEQFETLDVLMALGEISKLISAQSKITSVPKRKGG